MFSFSVFSVRLFVCLFVVVGYFRKKRYLILESYDKKVNLQRPVASVVSMRQLKVKSPSSLIEQPPYQFKRIVGLKRTNCIFHDLALGRKALASLYTLLERRKQSMKPA